MPESEKGRHGRVAPRRGERYVMSARIVRPRTRVNVRRVKSLGRRVRRRRSDLRLCWRWWLGVVV